MELHIKNNYAPNVEVNEGGTLNLYQDASGRWRQRQEDDDIEDAEVIEEVKEEVKDAESETHPADITLSERRQDIIGRLMALVDRGDWVSDRVAEDVKTMMRTILGQGGTSLTGKAAAQSEALWQLLENGRGDRVRIVWANMVGYLADRRLLRPKGAPALSKDFFGKEEGYTNIDKGRPGKNNMSEGFRRVLPLLDAYVPKIDKKA